MTTNVPYHTENNWFALQINWLVSTWWGTFVVNGLKRPLKVSVFPFTIFCVFGPLVFHDFLHGLSGSLMPHWFLFRMTNNRIIYDIFSCANPAYIKILGSYSPEFFRPAKLQDSFIMNISQIKEWDVLNFCMQIDI